MSAFRFKRFSVRNERSAMKVNTDGVLLGAATTVVPNDRRVLDVGTGTGTVALMIAQRLEAECSGADWHIQGIDIDTPSAEEAAENFDQSPWRDRRLSRKRTAVRAMTLSSLIHLITTIRSRHPRPGATPPATLETRKILPGRNLSPIGKFLNMLPKSSANMAVCR